MCLLLLTEGPSAGNNASWTLSRSAPK